VEIEGEKGLRRFIEFVGFTRLLGFTRFVELT